MRTVFRLRSCLFIAIVFGLFASGCATTPASYNTLNGPRDAQQLTRYTNLTVEVTCGSGVTIAPSDRDHILSLILKNVPEEAPGRFSAINPAAPDENSMHAVVNITRYDEGNAFARLMLAGLGQIHIDANISLSDFTTKDPLASYEVNKTFAWGGMYGGTTRIQDLHEAFAKGCAAAIVGKKQDSGDK